MQYVLYANFRLQEVTKKKSLKLLTQQMLSHINTKYKEIANKELKLEEEEDKKKAENEQKCFYKKSKVKSGKMLNTVSANFV